MYEFMSEPKDLSGREVNILRTHLGLFWLLILSNSVGRDIKYP